MKSIKQMLCTLICAATIVVPSALNAAFNSYVDIEVAGYAGETTLTNFPVLVRISEATITGFTYDSLQDDGKDIEFTSPDGSIIYSYEVDTWNTAGESLIWVLVPELTNGMVIRMSFGDPSITQSPAYTTDGSIWSAAGYSAVWHLGEANPTSADEIGISYDSTPNGMNATNTTASTSIADGLIGAARNIGTSSNGGGLIVTNWTDLAFENVFTVSAWVRHQHNGAWYDTIMSTKNEMTDKTRGWGFGVGTKFSRFYTYGTGSGRYEGVMPGEAASEIWHKIDFVYNGSSRSIYTNGVLSKATSNTSSAGLSTNTTFLAIGSNTGGTHVWRGDIDEPRFAYGQIRSADWIKAEYDNVYSRTLLSYDEVISESVQIFVQGDLGDFGTSTPAYGTSIDISRGETITASVDEVILLENGVERYVCTGYSHYSILDAETGEKELVQSGTENSFEYTHVYQDELIWHFKHEYYIQASVVLGDGSILFEDGWYEEGSTITLEIAPAAGENLDVLVGAPEGVDVSQNTITLIVASAMDLRAAFVPQGVDASIRYVSIDGSDENDGYTLATAMATLPAAINSIELALTEGTIYVTAGVYEQTETITLTNAIKIIGIADRADDVVFENVGEVRSFILDNADAQLANLVVSGGCHTNTYTNSGLGANVLIDTNGGMVTNCVLRNGIGKPSYSSGTGAYLNSDKALVTGCVITNNTVGTMYDIIKSAVGVYIAKGTLENSLVANNYCTHTGDGSRDRHYFHAGGVAVDAGNVINCTIVNNRGRLAGGLYINNSKAKVVNCVVVDNDLIALTDEYVTQAYDIGGKLDCVVNSVATRLTRVLEGEEEDTFSDENSTLVTDYEALFVDYASGDYVPRFKSILIDAGSITTLPSSTVDVRGRERIVGKAIDIGAYEAAFNNTVIIIR